MESKKTRGSFGTPEVPEQRPQSRGGSFGKQTPPPEAIEQQVESMTSEIEKEAEVVKDGPEAILKELGVEFTHEDFSSLIFRGFVEKTFNVIGETLQMKLKTLKVREYDVIDEILAEESETIKMTNLGYENRKSALTLAAAVEEIGQKGKMKKLVKEIPMLEDKKTPDLKELFKQRREFINEMAPSTINKAIRVHGSFVVATNMIAENPGDYAKNS